MLVCTCALQIGRTRTVTPVETHKLKQHVLTEHAAQCKTLQRTSAFGRVSYTICKLAFYKTVPVVKVTALMLSIQALK